MMKSVVTLLVILSISLFTNASTGYFDELNFMIKESKILKLSSRIPNTVILSENGKKVSDPLDPVLVLGTHISLVDFPDLEGYSKWRV